VASSPSANPDDNVVAANQPIFMRFPKP